MIEESDSAGETEIHIKCAKIDENLEKIIAAIRLCDNILIGKSDNVSYMINAADVFYFDTADDKIFIYTKEKVYETDLRIYQIEEKFRDTSFVRISKSAIVNLRKIGSIKSESYGRLLAELFNGEKIIISRQYMQNIKSKLGL